MTKDIDNSDLLILSDETENSDTILFEDNKVQIIEDENENKISDDLISFDDNISEKEETIELDIQEKKEDELNLGDFSFDSNEETLEEEKKEISDLQSEKENIEGLNLGDFTFDNNEETLDNKEEILDINLEKKDINEKIEDVSLLSMSSILDETINKLIKRGDLIILDKEKQEDNIFNLKKQISELEAKVSESEKIVSELNSEKTMISKNIKSLEKMKEEDITTEIKTSTSSKVHNLKRQKALA